MGMTSYLGHVSAIVAALITSCFITSVSNSNTSHAKECKCSQGQDFFEVFCTGSTVGLGSLDRPDEIGTKIADTAWPITQGFGTRSIKSLIVRQCEIEKTFSLPKNLGSLWLEETNMNGTILKAMLIQKTARTISRLTIINSPVLVNWHHSKLFQGVPALLSLSLVHVHLPVLYKNVLRYNSELRNLELNYCSIHTVEEGALEFLKSLTKLSMTGNLIKSLPLTLFKSLSSLHTLVLSSNQFEEVPHIIGPKFLMLLNLSDNYIISMQNFASSSLQSVKTLLLGNNKIREIRTDFLKNLTFTYLLDISGNDVTKVHKSLLKNGKNLMILNLMNNMIPSMPALRGLSRLFALYLNNNDLRRLDNDLFNETALKILLLHGNRLHTLARPFRGLRLDLLTLFGNPLQSIVADTFIDVDAHSNIFICFDDLLYIQSSNRTKVSMTCPSYQKVTFPKVDASLAKSINQEGFECDDADQVDKSYSCKACPPGHFNKGSSHCLPCPKGGFFQNLAAQKNCKRCNKGQFVNFYGGTSHADCQRCPFGTDPDRYADTRACYCLPRFAREDRFGACHQCSSSAFICSNESKTLAMGFWWFWDSKMRERYDCFRKNLMIKDTKYDTACSSFSGQLPMPHRCPTPEACRGGINADCHPFYHGPLCALCRKGHYRSGSRCFKCQSAGICAFKLLLACCLVIFCIALRYYLSRWKLKSVSCRTWGDVFMSHWKALLTFYQLLPIIVSLLSSLHWPDVVVSISSLLHAFVVEVFSLSFLGCIFQTLNTSAYNELIISLSVTGALTVTHIASFVIHLIWTAHKMGTSIRERMKLLCQSYGKSMLLITFVLYPGICERIFQVLPFNCHKLCYDHKKNNCTSYLRVDYGSKCPESNPETYTFVKIAYAALAIPILFPLFLLSLLWYERRKSRSAWIGQDNSKVALTRFLYENYHDKYWYWEIIELLKKLLYSVGFAFFGFNTKTNLGYLIIISGIFLIFYAYVKPVRYPMEHHLQTVTLSCIFLTLCISVLLERNVDANSSFFEIKNDRKGITIILLTVITFPLLYVTCRLLYTFLCRAHCRKK